MPFTDYTNQLYGKQGAGSVHMIGLPVDQWDIDPDQEEAVDPVLAEHTRVCAAGRLDWVKGALYAGGKRSFDAYCTNGRGWTGQVDGVEGLLVCTGWGGGGFKVAPAVGKIIAELAEKCLDRKRKVFQIKEC